MPIALLLPEYIIWHYTRALRLVLNIITNFIWFVSHFFSIDTSVRTLFAPLHGVSPELAFVSRFLGFGLRFLLVSFAYGMIFWLMMIGLIMLGFWLVLPGIVVVFGIIGFRLLFF